MNLFYFNQPTKRRMISMLMGLARSLFVQQCLYAVWFQGNSNTVPIRGRCNSPIPLQHLALSQDRTCFAQFNQLKNRGCKQRGTCPHANTHAHKHHTSLDQISKPWGFYYARLENGAIKPMSEAPALFLLPTLCSAPPFTN